MNVILHDLPYDVRGFTVKSCDGYTIVLNARHSREMNGKAYQHEMEHIDGGDFDGDDADAIELRQHKKKSPPTRRFQQK